MAQGMKKQEYYYKQASFGAGEMSPDLYGRDDLDRYAVGAKQLYNFFAHPFGGASNRPGTKFINSTKNSTKPARLVPFQFSQTQAYVLEFGDYYIRFYKDGGIIVDDSNNIVEITTPYSASEVYNLHFTQSADTLYICHRSFQPRTLTRSSHTVWTLAKFANVRGPVREENTTSATLSSSGLTGEVTVTSSSEMFDAKYVGSLVRISHSVDGQFVSIIDSSSSTTNPIRCYGDWSLVVSDPETGDLVIQQSDDNGSTWKTIKEYALYSTSAISDSGTTDHPCLLRMSWSGGSGFRVYLSATPYINDAFLTITEIISSTQIKATVYTDANDNVWGLTSTAATMYWALGAWNELFGYPRCCVFYQDRLVFASTTEDPLTLWFSETGNYVGFYQHSGTLQDDDAIIAPLVSSAVNAIENMVALGYILCFTAGGEWKVGAASASSALTYKSISAVQQSYIGASSLPPVVAGDRALYTTALGNVVNDFAYDVYSDTFKGADLTLYARHLFRNFSIIDWAYQVAPDNIIWAIRSDGKVLSFTFIKEQEVWAWGLHETNGTVESICSIAGDTQNDIYFVVKRMINGEVARYVEKLVPRMKSDNIRDQFFVDCGLSYDDPKDVTGVTLANPCMIGCTAHGLSTGDIIDILDVSGTTELNGMRYKVGVTTTDAFFIQSYEDGTNIDATGFTAYVSGGYIRKCVTTVSGLGHLEGEVVNVVADGGFVGTKTVESGSFTLDYPASIVHAGIPYTAKLRTLDLNLPRNDGTSAGRPKRINKVTVRVKDSKCGSVGVNKYTDMDELDMPEISKWGFPDDLNTADISSKPYSEYEAEASITVMQDKPFPLTVLALMAEIEME